MELDTLKKAIDIIFGTNFEWKETVTENDIKEYVQISLKMMLTYFMEQTLLYKRFVFFRIDDNRYKKKYQNLSFVDLVESFEIDLNRYYSYVSEYVDENGKYYELDKDVSDYIDFRFIPELNSKKYIQSRLEHLSELVTDISNRIDYKLDSEFKLCDKHYKYYIYDRNGNHELKDFFRYITPNSKDDSVKDEIERIIYYRHLDDFRFDILNMVEELKELQELKFDFFDNKEDANTFKKLINIFINFKDKHQKLFEYKDLNYNERRRYKRY